MKIKYVSLLSGSAEPINSGFPYLTTNLGHTVGTALSLSNISYGL
jgi:hypothetical protein